MADRWGKLETVTNFIFLGSKITVDGDYSHETKRHLRLERKAMTNIDSVLKGRDITWPTKVYGFSSSHVWMWEIDPKEGCVSKNSCFPVLEEILKSPLDKKEIKSFSAKGNHPWIFIERADGWSWSSNTLPTRCKELTQWNISWCGERLREGGEGDDRGWDGWWHHQLNGHKCEQTLPHRSLNWIYWP